MYKINEVQLLVEVEGYIPFHKGPVYNEIELLPSKSSRFNTVIQEGISTRGRIKFQAYTRGYEDYKRLQNYRFIGLKFPFKDRYNTYDNMIIFELGEPVRQNDEIIAFDIELIEVDADV